VTPEAPTRGAAATRPPRARPAAGDLPVMSFFEHLEELRSTLLFAIIVAAVSAGAAWFVSQPILDLLIPPGLGRVYFSSPAEGFMIRLKVSGVTGLLFALPLVIGRLWGFVAPGLFRHERRAVVPTLVAGTLLFYGGVVFCYMAVVPRMVDFFLSFAGPKLSPLINVTEYFMFVAKFCLAFGIAFQLPLVMVLLAALGLVTPGQLWRQWRYGILAIAVLSAWLTPPDVMSQIMMGGPLVVLYMASIGLSFLVARRRRRRRT
jgi:sec-independent protein translocase protein TatC